MRLNSQKIDVVVPVSGGKDSQSCLKLAVESQGAKKVLGVFFDTGWEHPKTYEHISFMEDFYGVEIKKVKKSSVYDEVLKAGSFPNSQVRFCTSRLKIRPSNSFFQGLAKSNGGFQVWYGMRSQESRERLQRYAGIEPNELFPPHELNTEYPQRLHRYGVGFRLPILGWTESDVFEFLGNNINPLYRLGFDRVGCFPCLASTAKKHSNCFNFGSFGQEQKEKIINLENALGKKHRPANTSQMCMFCSI